MREGGDYDLFIYLVMCSLLGWCAVRCCTVWCGVVWWCVRCGAVRCGVVAPAYIHGWLAVVMHVNDVASRATLARFVLTDRKG